MFYCQAGKHVTVPGTKLHKKVTKTRAKTYVPRDQRTSNDKPVFFDNGGVGTEIVEEIDSCVTHL